MMEIRLKSTYLEPLFVCLCLLTVLGPANGATVVKVEEGSEAVLPCFISPKRNIEGGVFDWKKDEKQEVFMYNAGKHYNNGLTGQDKQFKGRVSHFPEQLQSGNASIKINNTKLSDSGNYTCDYSPDQPNRQRFTIELVVGATVVTVREGSEAVLPCLIRPERNIRRDVFEWKKDGQKEVFFYVSGSHYNNGLTGQDEQFKGRVSHFPEQLQSGDASIVIRDTKLSDSGTYICDYSPDQPDRQTSYIELNVVTCPKPHITLLKQTEDWAQLQCEVGGVSPNHKVEVKDSDGNILSAEETHTESKGSYNIILNTTVTKTDNYHCIVTQEDICHHTSDEIPVNVPGTAVEPYVTTLQTEEGVLLQCFVQSPSPQPEVEWQDSDGEKLPAKEPQVTERKDGYDIILQAVVTKTDNFRCVVTQKEIKHQTTAEIYAQYDVSGSWIGLVATVVVLSIILLVVLLLVLYTKRRKIQRFICGPQTKTEEDVQGDPDASDKKGLQPDSTGGDGDENGEPTESVKLELEPLSV